MRVIPNGSNQTIVESKGCTVLYSYNTAVALESPDGVWYRTEEKHSVTTSKHINKFIPNGKDNPDVVLVPQSVMDTWDSGAHQAFAPCGESVVSGDVYLDMGTVRALDDNPTSWSDC